MDYLTDFEIAKIEAFNADEGMSEAVHKVLLAGLYTHGVIKKGKKHDPLQNGAFSLAAMSTNNPLTDEVLGQHIRGMWAGVNALEVAFKSLGTIKSKAKSIPSPINEAI